VPVRFDVGESARSWPTNARTAPRGFFINVPIGIAMMLAARNYLAKTERHAGQLDLVGAFGSTLGMTALAYGIARSADAGWTDSGTGVALAAGCSRCSW
jgi:hypothetical protein